MGRIKEILLKRCQGLTMSRERRARRNRIPVERRKRERIKVVEVVAEVVAEEVEVVEEVAEVVVEMGVAVAERRRKRRNNSTLVDIS